MFTVCPKCALTLVVTAADLRVAQGYVRCGRCSSVFNALAGLSDERQAAASPEVPAAMPEAAPAEPPPQPAPPEEDPAPAPESPAADAAGEAAAPEPEEKSLEFNEATDLDSVFVQAQPDPQWTAATGSFRALIAANQESATPPADQPVDVEIDANFFAAMLGSESANESVQAPPVAATPQAPEVVPLTRPAPARDPAPGIAERAAAGRPPRTPGHIVAVPARPAPEIQDEAAPETAMADEEGAEAQASWRTQAGWIGASALAAMLLIAQVVNHYRDALATRPALRSSLQSFYGALGVALYPEWDLQAYDVRQLGADAGGAGSGLITVRASVKNGAAQPQPLPLLRVTLQDRFGNRIASRDVGPRSYLPKAVPAAAYLSSGQRIDAEMGFADPGADAVGFEIDACLPARGGVIACANDATLR